MAFPTEITAGDPSTWTESATDASEKIVYAIRRNDDLIARVDGSNDGTNHAFTLSAGASAGIEPGWYESHRVVYDGAGDRDTGTVARLLVNPDPLKGREQSHNEKMVEFIESALEARASGGDIETRSFGGLSVTKTPTVDLVQQLKRYKSAVLAEKARRGDAPSSIQIEY